MYLKRIEMQGFKSFANKTEIEFKKDITAIVGPNGSGKSNISDAIRWVLGEQSAKSLRGSKMEDIIFSGTDKRRALGFAEVSMVFDNKDRHIPVDYNEVSITRRMFRSGESEFYINKNSCRLKDIHELFMDTGIGKDGYSIIGQGRIDEILSDRPEDRRSIFEEAAGIVKYKSKKEETERKLSRTEDNLIRINDLLHEITKQKETLEVDANKAKEFTVLYDELKLLEVNLYIMEIDKLQEEIQSIKMELENDNKEIDLMEKSKIQIEESFNELKDVITKIEYNIEQSRTDKFDLLQSLERDKNQMSLLKEKEGFYKKDRERLNEEMEQLHTSIQTIDKKIQDIKVQKASVNKDHQRILEKSLLKDQELLEISNNLGLKEEQLEREKNKVIKIYNNMSDNRSQLNSIESFNENIDKRLTQLSEEINNKEENKDELAKNLAKILNNEKDLREDLEKSIVERSKYKSEEMEFKKLLDNISEEGRTTQIKLQGIVSSYNLYRNMEEGYEGYYRSVKNLLNSIKNSRVKSKGYIGVVAELLKVDVRYEKAIDISLGSALQNVVTETENDAKIMIEFLKKNNMGRVTFLPLNSIRGNTLNIDIDSLREHGVLGLGHDLVRYDEKYSNLFRNLLGRTIIVDNIDNGINLARRFNHRYRIVTLDGDVLNPGGSLTGGSYNNNALSLISRKNKIKQLKDEIEDHNDKLNKLEEEKNLVANKHVFNDESLENKEKEIKDTELKIIQHKNEKEVLSMEIQRLEGEIYRNKRDIDSLRKEMDGFGSKKGHYIEVLKNLDDKSIEVKVNIDELNEDINMQKELKDKIHKDATEFRISLNNVENKLNNFGGELESSTKERKNIIYSLESRQNSIKDIDKELVTILEERERILKEIRNKEVEGSKASGDLDDFTSKKNKSMESFYEMQDSLKEINEKLNLMERAKNEIDLKLSKSTLQYGNKNTRLVEDYELHYEEAIQLKDESIDFAKSKPKVAELKNNIRLLGSVNLGSIEDYGLVKERLDFLEKQHTDLVDSKESLKRLIKDMEKKMKENFMESFRDINENFSKVFSVLFNGGVANLELDPDEDILKSGIEIRVQPPGKRLQNINLLSGGEKSLTAVALLFAILELKPAPFCILDEIDAALDEANVERYTDYLKSFNEDTQFILITHRKTTMEISNVLYGVTMAEEGVSRLISVELKDYVEDLVS